jgi:hypothetical protein
MVLLPIRNSVRHYSPFVRLLYWNPRAGEKSNRFPFVMGFKAEILQNGYRLM